MVKIHHQAGRDRARTRNAKPNYSETMRFQVSGGDRLRVSVAPHGHNGSFMLHKISKTEADALWNGHADSLVMPCTS